MGLLIAVGIEGLVERHSHRELAEQARATMTAEIRKNQASVRDALQEIADERKKMDSNVAAVRKVQMDPNGPAANEMNVDVSFGSTGVEETVWKTAQATAALSYMPYEEAEKFSSIYNIAEAFTKSQDRLFDDEAEFLGTIGRFHVGDGKVSKDAADALAERLGVWQGHLLTITIAARVLQEQQNAFLEGREPLHHMSEKMGN